MSQHETEENAHTLALVIDNMSNYMLMGFQLKYKEIWIRNVKNVMKEDENAKKTGGSVFLDLLGFIKYQV